MSPLSKNVLTVVVAMLLALAAWGIQTANDSRASVFVRGCLWSVAVGMIVLLLALTAHFARAADNGHTHEGAAGRFYQSWMMPSNRTVSCCHEQDCSPAEAYQKNGQWFARQLNDTGEFTPIDAGKVENDRDSPDGRSHLCGRRYGFSNNNFSVFCFIAGAGG